MPLLQSLLSLLPSFLSILYQTVSIYTSGTVLGVGESMMDKLSVPHEDYSTDLKSFFPVYSKGHFSENTL